MRKTGPRRQGSQRTGLDGGPLPHSVADPNCAIRENLCPQAAPVDQATQDPGPGEFFYVGAGFAQPNTAQSHFPDLKLPPYQVIQGGPGE